MSENRAVLILSGVDPTNGAGLGRDILTVKETGCYPLSVPTVLTVQNSMKFHSSKPVNIEYIRHSIDLLKDEFSIKTIKTGLVPTDEKWLKEFSQILSDFSCPIIVDTVIKATTDNSGINIPKSYLNLIRGNNRILTPNLRELRNLHQFVFNTEDSSKNMAKNISKEFGCRILTTFEGTKDSIAITDGNSTETIKIELIDIHKSYHGTGCTFSSALASFIASGYTLSESIKKAATYTSQKIASALKFKDKGQYFLY